MDKKIIILGAGGHCKVIIDILEEGNEYKIAGIVDNTCKNEFVGISVIGTDEELQKIFNAGIKYAFVAIGSNSIRSKLIVKLKSIGYTLINVISNKANLSSRAVVGEGIAIMPGAIVNAYANIGNGCIINTAATIDHDTSIGEFSHIAPGVNISGNSVIGKQCFIGVGANIIDGITIGNETTLGAGATVVKNLPSRCVAVGIPAHVIKQI